MPSPSPNLVRTPTKKTVGVSPLPKWREAMSPGTWAQIGRNMLSDIDPAKNPTINPNYPASPEWRAVMGQAAIVLAWCGACLDSEKYRLWLPLGGGHSDYAGNEAYYFDLLDDSPVWKMPRPPSGAIGNLLTTRDGKETTGVYADGQPRAMHSYNKHVFIPGLGVICTMLGGTAWSAKGGANDTWKLDAATGLWSKIATAPRVGATQGAACYDPNRRCVWFVPASDGHLLQLDLASMQWRVCNDYQRINGWGYRRLLFLADDDLMLQFDDLMAGGFCVWDMAAKTYTTPGTSGPAPQGFDASAMGKAGSDWNSAESFVAIWHHLSNTETIATLTPGANKKTSPWIWGQIAPAGNNVVKPTARIVNGTYGRFGYSAGLNGYFLQNEVSQKTYFFAAGLA